MWDTSRIIFYLRIHVFVIATAPFCSAAFSARERADLPDTPMHASMALSNSKSPSAMLHTTQPQQWKSRKARTVYIFRR